MKLIFVRQETKKLISTSFGFTCPCPGFEFKFLSVQKQKSLAQ